MRGRDRTIETKQIILALDLYRDAHLRCGRRAVFIVDNSVDHIIFHGAVNDTAVGSDNAVADGFGLVDPCSLTSVGIEGLHGGSDGGNQGVFAIGAMNTPFPASI